MYAVKHLSFRQNITLFCLQIQAQREPSENECRILALPRIVAVMSNFAWIARMGIDMSGVHRYLSLGEILALWLLR